MTIAITIAAILAGLFISNRFCRWKRVQDSSSGPVNLFAMLVSIPWLLVIFIPTMIVGAVGGHGKEIPDDLDIDIDELF